MAGSQTFNSALLLHRKRQACANHATWRSTLEHCLCDRYILLNIRSASIATRTLAKLRIM